MHLLLVAATPFEIGPTLAHLEQHFSVTPEGIFHRDDLRVQPLVTGVGLTATAFHLGRALASARPDLALNAGVAGSFRPDWPLGTVVNVVSERFGDLGVEEADGRFTDMFELGLIDANTPPFIGGALHNPAAAEAAFLPPARGLSVQRVHGYPPSIEAVCRKYPDAEVESMEGAAFFYACLQAGVPFLELRALSNYVEARNRAGWQLGTAIERLNETVVEVLGALGR